MPRRPLLRIVAFVQAQMLERFLRWLRTFHHDGIQGSRQEQMVVYICACDADSQWAASCVDKQALLDAQLATVGGVRANAFVFWIVCFWLTRLALAPFLPMKRALLRQPSADCQSQ